MIPQNLVHLSEKELPPPANVDCEVNDADVDGEVTEMKIAPSDGASDTTGMAVRVTNFDIALFRHQDLLRYSQIRDLEILLRDISGIQVFFLRAILPGVWVRSRERNPSRHNCRHGGAFRGM